MELCCTPIGQGSLDQAEAEDLARLLSALADPMRLRIVSMLAENGEICGCELEVPLGISQPTVSHHLSVLRQAGLVVGERRGRWVHYRLAPERLEEMRRALAPSPSLV